MAAKNTTTTSRDELVNLLLNAQQVQASGPTVTERLQRFAADSAAESFNTAAVIAGALTGALGNAKQAFHLEANFRTAERTVKARRMAEQYAARLEALMQP